MSGQLPNHPLMGKFDLDPGSTRPYWYGVEIDVPVEAGSSGVGSINLLNQPFIWTRTTHAIVGCTGFPDTTGLNQDGQYTIAFQDEQTQYQNIPIMAEAMFGTTRAGDSIWMPYPIPFAGNKTITFKVTNRCTRVLSPVSETFTVQIALSGFVDLGRARPQR